MKKPNRLILAAVLILAGLSLGCSPAQDERQDTNDSVPKGDSEFPPLGYYWVIDEANVLTDETIVAGDAILEQLKQARLAEVVVVVINGVKQPKDWATHYGRHLGLGKTGSAAEGGNRGLVWLIRPDAELKLTVSVGRGLPRLTTVDYGQIMYQVKDYFNFGNYDAGVELLIEETDAVLRELYGQG